MRAVCWYGTTDVRVETVPDPKIINPRDAVVKITSTAICGSDLHLYDGYNPTMQKSDILGHEFMGEVVELGSAVKNVKIGDRVVVNSRCLHWLCGQDTNGCCHEQSLNIQNGTNTRSSVFAPAT